MAKKSTKKSQTKTEQPGAATSEVKPGIGDYIKAASQVLATWVRGHKTWILLALAGASVIIGLAVVLLRTEPLDKSDDAVVAVVNKNLGISGDSNPAVLSVVDENKVAQPFLDDSKNGDKVLLYYKAKKSVLFRPSTGAVIRQGAFTPPDAKIFLRLGTADYTKLEEIKTKISAISDIDITSEDTSPKKDYKGITLVNVSDRYDEQASRLSSVLGVQPVLMPRGETIPDADFLIIVGD